MLHPVFIWLCYLDTHLPVLPNLSACISTDYQAPRVVIATISLNENKVFKTLSLSRDIE